MVPFAVGKPRPVGVIVVRPERTFTIDTAPGVRAVARVDPVIALRAM